MSDATAIFWKGRYEIERPLGRGGMSAVYLAKDHQLLAKRVVVKVLLEEMSQDAWMRQKFFQEMEALARIDHPGVVGVLDSGQTPEGKQFLVMQYVEGQTLRSEIVPGGMPLEKAAGLIRQIGQALGAAHDAGVWHRDLKPENIMLQKSGGELYAKLIDFGIAGIQDSQFTGEKTKVAGSLTYMAPEQFAGNPCASSDIYALGVVAYEMLTGDPPFSSSSMSHLVAPEQTITLPRARRSDIPERASQAILKAISFRPEARQASARELADELYNALCGAVEPDKSAARAVPAAIPSMPPITAGAPPRKSKAPAIAAAAVAVVVLAAGGWYAMRPKPPAAAPATVAAPVVEPLSLTYKLEGDASKLAFDIATPKSGFLYVLNYGKDGDKWTLNLLHPLNGGKADRQAGQILRVPETGYFFSNNQGPKETPYLVWSAEAVPEIEAMKFSRRDHGVSIVDDPEKVDALLKFLKDHEARDVSRSGDQTEVRSNGKVLAHAISLQ